MASIILPTTVTTITSVFGKGELDCAMGCVPGVDVDVGFDVTDFNLVTVLGDNAVDTVVVTVAFWEY
jgi:hypothetical protein